jgi:hypothetical protein
LPDERRRHEHAHGHSTNGIVRKQLEGAHCIPTNQPYSDFFHHLGGINAERHAPWNALSGCGLPRDTRRHATNWRRCGFGRISGTGRSRIPTDGPDLACPDSHRHPPPVRLSAHGIDGVRGPRVDQAGKRSSSPVGQLWARATARFPVSNHRREVGVVRVAPHGRCCDLRPPGTAPRDVAQRCGPGGPGIRNWQQRRKSAFYSSKKGDLKKLATFRRKIDVFGSTVNGLRPSKDRRAAGGHF